MLKNIFRRLKENEICVEKYPNAGGVKLMLWKSGFAVPDVLDDSVGPDGWYMEYENGNKNCTLHVRLGNGSWISRTGFGDKPTAKALADDSMSRAGALLGIGRELYHTPELFVSKEDLPEYSYNKETKEAYCPNTFRVMEIRYGENSVEFIRIGIERYGKVVRTIDYGTKAAPEQVKNMPEKEAEKAASAEALTEKKAAPPAVKTAPAEKKAEAPALFTYDEVILIGNCRGMKYGDAKNTPRFKNFLAWAKKSTSTYDDPKKDDQLRRFKEL